MPLSEYRYQRRVQFADTDLAGVVHFSWIVKYMEEAEHALWRGAGLTISPADGVVSYPRVALSVDFKAPLHFEEEFEVHVRIASMSRRAITYAHTIRRGETVIATGTMTAACVRKLPPPMKSTEIPPEVLDRLQPYREP